MEYKIVSPHNQSLYRTVPLASPEQADAILKESHEAQKKWKLVSLEERKKIVEKFIDYFILEKEEVASELAHSIGRPLSQNFNEVKGFEFRARSLLSIVDSALAPTVIEDSSDFNRFITREPLGVIFIITAWNYPYLISVNGVVPAILAGNSVILKQAPQTFLCASRFQAAFDKAGLPKGVFQALYVDHPTAEPLLKSPLVNYVHFTGSVGGGAHVQKLVTSFAGVGLELGGKDSAYVRADADPVYTAEQLVDGAMYNSGQSCCAIERIYVHENIYDAFVSHAVKTAKAYVLGNPLDPKTNLGPVISIHQANHIRAHLQDAADKGATLHIDETEFPISKAGTAFVAPQILTNVNHDMLIMSEETFGPVVGIMKVSSDDEAIRLMNDSKYGLTASVWTKDQAAGLAIGRQMETGTFFVNRCDYLDPFLPWVGIKNSGRGCTLSKCGFEQLTRPKSYHLKK